LEERRGCCCWKNALVIPVTSSPSGSITPVVLREEELIVGAIDGE
jgi:hypothetical protein